MEPEGQIFAMRKDLSFIARTIIKLWFMYSSLMASLYFKKSSTDRNSNFSTCSQTAEGVVLVWVSLEAEPETRI